MDIKHQFMKRTTGLLLILIVCLFTALQQKVVAQDTTKVAKEYKNTIHFNITHPIIFGGKSIIFGYERVLNKKRSFSFNIGQTGFPTLNIISSDSIKASTLRDESGFHISADYRFYLEKENKYNAPRGIYIGPYFSYNYFEKEHSWELKSTAGGTLVVDSKTSLSATTVGIEAGYQFIFWNRVALDMVLIGPGIAAYNLKALLGSNLSDADREKFFQKLNEALAEKFPGYSVAVDEGEFKKKGSTNSTNFGFRYMLQLGYRF